MQLAFKVILVQITLGIWIQALNEHYSLRVFVPNPRYFREEVTFVNNIVIVFCNYDFDHWSIQSMRGIPASSCFERVINASEIRCKIKCDGMKV